MLQDSDVYLDAASLSDKRDIAC